MKKFIYFILILFAISIEAMAQDIQKFRNTKGDLLVLKWSGGKKGLYNSTKGQWVISPQYEDIQDFLISNNYGYTVARDSRNAVGAFDSNGVMVIPFNKYQGIIALPGRLFLVNTKDYKYGVIDVNGRVVCPFGKYDDIYPQGSLNKGLSKVLLVAKKSGKLGLINVNGNPVTDFIYDWIDFPSYSDVPNTLAVLTCKDYKYYVNYNWDVIKVINKNTGQSPITNNQNTTSRSYNSGIQSAAVLGVFVGLAAIAVDYISSHSSSSSSSSYSSSSSSRSSYSSSSSSRSTSLCSYCSGRGMMNCVWCHGTGVNKGGWFESDKVCFSCKGKGQYWCYHCSGRGSR